MPFKSSRQRKAVMMKFAVVTYNKRFTRYNKDFPTVREAEKYQNSIDHDTFLMAYPKHLQYTASKRKIYPGVIK